MVEINAKLNLVNDLDKIPRTPGAFFLYISKKHMKWALLAITSVILAATISTASSYFFKLIIDAVDNNDINSAMFWGLLFPVTIFVDQILYRLSGYAAMHWTIGSNKSATDTLINYLFRHSHSYFIDRFAGSITNKIRNVTSAFDETIPDFLWAHLNALITFLVTFILIFRVDIKSAAIFVGLIIVLFLINMRFAPRKALVSKENAEAGTKLQGRIVDAISNISAIRQYVKEDFELVEIQQLTTNKFNKSKINWFYTEKLLLINSVVLFLFALLMFWILVTKWGQGYITTGDFVLVLALVSNITGTLLFIGRAFNATARTFGELKEGLDDILLPINIIDSKNAQSLVVKKASILWDNVCFSFDSNAVFRGFNLNIPAKQRLGLVGSSGAGKSTFVALILRQHDLISGQISIDGQDISRVTQSSLRRAIAVVPQEPILFHRTIRENIMYSNPQASMEEIVEIAKRAQAHSFIEKLPNGYDTMVGERGVKLSGGQKQRVAIARAMLKNSPILILDEATSALDSESEKDIQIALHELMEGKTVIAIAHRLSTLKEMDRIVVLEGGEIKEDGTHESLVKQSGQYARLWSHQAGGFILD